MRRALLFGVLWLIVGCGSSGPGPVYSTAGVVPAALQGTWTYEVFGSQLCDPTNHCVPSFVHSQTLSLTATSFAFVRYEETNTSTCTLIVTTEGRGTAVVDGASLLLYVDQGSTRSDDSCGQSDIFDERGNTWAYTWDVAGNQLMLIDAQGNQLGPFLRQPGQ